MAAGTQIGNVLFTDIGGVASRMVAEENLAAGELVSAGTVDGKVVKTATSGKTSLGVVFEAVSANADVWVVTSGIARLLPEAGVTATRGQVAFSSASTAGRVAQSATDASRKVGVFNESGTGAGALAKATLQLVGVDAASIGASGTTAFTWSTSEQTWPFEKGPSGETIYATYFNYGACPNAAQTSKAHGKTFTAGKFLRWWGVAQSDADNVIRTLPSPWGSGYEIHATLDETNATITTGFNATSYDANFFFLYWK